MKDAKFAHVSGKFYSIIQEYRETQRKTSELYNPSPTIQREQRAQLQQWVDTQGQYLMVTGIYQWVRAFNGEWLDPGELDYDNLDEFDVLLVGWTGVDMELISNLKEARGKSKTPYIVACLDYGVDLFPNNLAIHYGGTFRRNMLDADLVFAAESRQREVLEFLLGKEVPLLYHPCSITELREVAERRRVYGREEKEKLAERSGQKLKLSVVIHSWRPDPVTPYLALNSNVSDRSRYRIFCYNIPESESERLLHCYDMIAAPLPYARFIEHIVDSYVVVDSYSVYSYGRMSIESAALGIPCIGSCTVESQRVLWPELTIDPYDIKKIRELSDRLYDDKDFYDEVVSYAQQALVGSYDLKSRREALLEHLGMA